MKKQNEESDGPDVEIFHRVNRLKVKAGLDPEATPGKINPESINRANNIVEENASAYEDEIKTMLSQLREQWNIVKAKGDDSEESLKTLSNTANQIKDLGTTFGYDLMGYFAESLRDFLLSASLNVDEHYIITQAHIDTMDVVLRDGIKGDDGSSEAEILKNIVAKAIEKYSVDDEGKNG